MGNVKRVHDLNPEQPCSEILSIIKSEFEDLKRNFLPQQPTEYLSRKDVANLLDVDLSTISNWCKQKKLKPLRIGGRILFRRSDIDNAIVEL